MLFADKSFVAWFFALQRSLRLKRDRTRSEICSWTRLAGSRANWKNLRTFECRAYIDNLSAALKRLTFMLSSSQSERSAGLELIVKEHGRRKDLLSLGLLVLVCAVFAWLRWAKLDELLWGDPVHWLHEVSRVAAGH